MLDDLRTYKANAVKENRPLLFLGSSSVLDVSNKSMFRAFQFSQDFFSTGFSFIRHVKLDAIRSAGEQVSRTKSAAFRS